MYLNKGQAKDNSAISDIPHYIESGYVLIMKDMDDVYSSLYDVLNQKYFKLDANDKKEYTYVHFGTNSAPRRVEVNKKFRVIIFMNRLDGIQNIAERSHPAPFLNRCEKHLVVSSDLVNSEDDKIVQIIVKDYNITFDNAKDYFNPSHLIHNYNREMIERLLLNSEGSHSAVIKNKEMSYYIKNLVMYIWVIRSNLSTENSDH